MKDIGLSTESSIGQAGTTYAPFYLHGTEVLLPATGLGLVPSFPIYLVVKSPPS